MRAAGLDLARLGPAARARITEAQAAGAIALGPDSPLRETTGRTRRNDDPESREQKAVIAWRDRVADRVPELRWLAAVPNGGRRSKGAAGRAKGEGVSPGYPDLLLDVPHWLCHGLRIEMKMPGRPLSAAQRDWHAHLTAAGYRVVVCRSAAEARAALCAYLGVADPEGEGP